MAEIQTIIIIGAGQAGLQAAQALRARGFDGRIRLLGDEGFPPYQRPPLSKAFLKGEFEEQRLFFKPVSFFTNQRIELTPRCRVTHIDRSCRLVKTEAGQEYKYDRLVIAAGARARTLKMPGAYLDGVMTLRGLDDAIRLRSKLAAAKRVSVIGGGYIGLETAAAVRQMGLDVAVFERLPRLLARVTSPPISDFYLKLHREHGVDVHCDTDVVAIEGSNRATGVRLSSGEEASSDIVLIGVGAAPNQELAADAGLKCDDGVIVDENCRTSDPAIYAAGDCARQSFVAHDTPLRLESVHNALVQGERIAADILDDPAPAYDPPWFWSDQYDVKLQTVGLSNNYTNIVIRGDATSKRFAAFYYDHDRLIAIDAINDPASFLAGKQLLKNAIPLPRRIAADVNASLKDVLSQNRRLEAAQ